MKKERLVFLLRPAVLTRNRKIRNIPIERNYVRIYEVKLKKKTSEMFETILQGVGNVIRLTFIPVLHAAPNEMESRQNENVIERLKLALTPGYELDFKTDYVPFCCHN